MKKKRVLVIGASMIDITGRSYASVIAHDSNPGKVRINAGGVCRNIAENLARLGVVPDFISTISNDVFGQIIKKSCEAVNIDISECYFTDDESTVYMGILDNNGDMALALSDTSSLDKMPIDFIKSKKRLIDKSDLIIIDCGLSKEILHYLLSNFSHKDFYLDPVSVTKAEHVVSLIDKLHMVKCNHMEAEYLSDMAIKNNDDVVKCAEILLKKGIKKVIITLGKDGVYYNIDGVSGFYKHREVVIKNATGAGDAFLAVYIFGYINNLSVLNCIKIASEVAALTLESYRSVNESLSCRMIDKYLY